MKGGICLSLCLCGSIRDGDCHRGGVTTETQSAQRRPNPQKNQRNLIPPCHALLCVLCVSAVQFGAVTVIEGIHHRDAERTEKTLTNRMTQRSAKTLIQ